jgi:hypothetical protein
MRLSETTIKQAILHPEADIRGRALAYFAKSYSQDASVMPLVVEAVETYGKQDAYHLIGLATDLAQTDNTVSWIIDELSEERNASYENYAYNLSRVLCDADVALLVGKKSRIIEARHFLPDYRDALLERLDVLSWDEATCWRKLEKLCEDGKDKEDIPLKYANHIVEALARMGNGCEERIRSVLSQQVVSLENNPLKWMEPLMIELAGRLRLERTIPLIVEKLHEDDDFLAPRCADALTRIGTDAVMKAVADQFFDGEQHFRIYAIGPLEHVHSDVAVKTCLRLLPSEKDRWIKRELAHAALAHFATDAIEPARQMLFGKKLSAEDRHLRNYLVETCKIMGERFPEYDQWLADGERERLEHQRTLHELRDDPNATLAYVMQRIQEQREDDDEAAATQLRSGRFAVGNHVRVRHGVVDIDYADLPLGGWAGIISAIDKDGMCLLRWSEETLENIHPLYRKRCERDGADFEEYWVKQDDIEPDLGGPLSIEQPTNIITPPLSMDDQDDRIRSVFGLTSDDPLPEESDESELTYFNYLKANLAFPFAAQFHDPVKDRRREVTVVGMCDSFSVDEGFGVMCEVLDGGEKTEMPVSELEVQQDNPNYQMVDDYITWFVNAPETGVEEDVTEDWDEEFDDQELDEEFDGEDEEPPPPPIRQKVGRNDPCPCGSKKKFKKCCLRKQGGGSLVD